MLARLLLRPKRAPDRAREGSARRIGRFATRHPVLVLAFTLVVLATEGFAASRVGFSFFPSSDREQMVVQLELPEGTHTSRTDDMARQLERELLAMAEVRSVTSVVGQNVPLFYYNLVRRPTRRTWRSSS